jgi:hypothetical protein
MRIFVAGLEREGTPGTGLAASLRKLAEGESQTRFRQPLEGARPPTRWIPK